MYEMTNEQLVDDLRGRAKTRRSITTRKSVQEGKPDRLADLLDLAATRIALLIGYDETLGYSDQYDAYYNKLTNEWVESKCSDPTCEQCMGRPERPL